MKNTTVNGFDLRFDWGAMEQIALLTGCDAIHPLKGIEALVDQAAAVLAGSFNRNKERAELPERMSLEQARKEVRDMSPGQLMKLMSAYNASTEIDSDNTEPADDEFKKK